VSIGRPASRVRAASLAVSRCSALAAFLALLGQGPDLLDERQQLGTTLTNERLTEQRTDPPDVGPQGGIVAAGSAVVEVAGLPIGRIT